MLKTFIETGRIVSTHGIKGEFRVDPWSDSTDFLKQFKKLYLDPDGKQSLDVVSVRVSKNVNIVKVKGIDRIEDAEKLRGKTVYIDRNDADIGDSYFVQDIIGCEVFDVDSNAKLGVLSDVSETGANDVWHIKNNENEYLIPVIDEVVIDVSVADRKIVIRPLKGIFDDED